MDVALFLDFDGTLVDIAPRPDAVSVEPGLVENLTRLRDRLGGALAIVTGRPVSQIDGFLAPVRLDAAGLHGVERRVDGVLTGGGPRIIRPCARRSSGWTLPPPLCRGCSSRTRAHRWPCIGALRQFPMPNGPSPW